MSSQSSLWQTMDETADNRKRSLGYGDENEFDKMAGLSSKRPAIGAATGDVSSGAQAYLLKMLCPRDCVGNIIGKGGSVISELNVTTGARIKISQNNEFFPQTNDRVIVISGSTEKIATALTELITKMIEAPDKTPPATSDVDLYGNPAHPAIKDKMTLRLLIPTSASGMIIGKHGASIKSMSEESSCHIQLGDNADPYKTNERILSITGKGGLSSLIHGAHMAAAQLFSGEPSKVTYSNIRTSYALPGGPPLPAGMPPGAGGSMYGGGGYGGPMGMSGMMPMYYQQSPPSQSSSAAYGQSFDVGLGYDASRGGRGGRGGRREGSGSDRHAMGGMGDSLGFDPLIGLSSSSGQGYQSSTLSSGGVYGPGGNSSAPSVLDQISPPLYSSLDGNLVTMQMGVPDHLVGSVLGKGGCTVKEVMAVSGASIQISQKDNYLPGTQHRSIVVKGSQNQVQTALSIIMIKLHG